MARIQKQYVLEGLSCEHCGGQIERAVGQLKGVYSAMLNPESGVLTLIYESETVLLPDIIRIAAIFDEEVMVREYSA